MFGHLNQCYSLNDKQESKCYRSNLDWFVSFRNHIFCFNRSFIFLLNKENTIHLQNPLQEIFELYSTLFSSIISFCKYTTVKFFNLNIPANGLIVYIIVTKSNIRSQHKTLSVFWHFNPHWDTTYELRNLIWLEFAVN